MLCLKWFLVVIISLSGKTQSMKDSQQFNFIHQREHVHFIAIEVPKMYNKAYVDVLIADIYHYFDIKTEIGTLFSNLDVSSYCFKTEIGTLFSYLDLSNYCTKSEVDDIDNGLSTLVLNTYTKTEVDTLLYTSYLSLSFIVDNFIFKN